MNDKIKILIAEHDPIDLELLHHELKTAGIIYESEAVHNEPDYINSLKNFVPDIILSDYTFPSFNGTKAFGLREKIAPATPFIFVSGTIGEEKSIELIKNGVTDYVLKESLFTLAFKVKRALKESEDITEKKRLEKAFENERQRLLLATKSAGIFIWEWDIKNDHLQWDKGMYELYKINDSQFGSIYQGWLARLHPEDKERVNEDIQKAITGKKEYDTEFRIIWGGDLSVHHIKATGIIEKDTQGNTIRLIGLNWDITKQKEKEQQLKLLESVITHTTDSVLITEAEPFDEPGHKIVYVNEAFTKMTGYSSKEIVGKTPRILQGEKSDKVELKRFSNAIRKWQSCEITIINYKKNGEEFWVNFSASPIANENGWYTHWISIEKDVTERKLAEIHLSKLNEELQKHAKELSISNTELEQFAYVASHDLQEPLRMITSFLTQLEKKYGAVIDDKGKKYIDFAVDGAKRMRQIILDLLEFSKVGKTDEAPEELDLNELVNEIKILFRKRIEDKKAVIIIDKLPEVHAHGSPMRQVFQNLIGNALKYSKKDIPARIHITVKELNDHWQFAVMDNGIGINNEYFDKIFIIFQRLHNKDEYSGTGMGLAITKKIVENLGGKIWVESEESKGSTFYFTILKQP
jgi:PAS domain S-box-containing protein